MTSNYLISTIIYFSGILIVKKKQCESKSSDTFGFYCGFTLAMHYLHHVGALIYFLPTLKAGCS